MVSEKMMKIEMEELIGKTFKQVTLSDDREYIIFETTEGEVYKMFHSQSCCEHVYIESITGDLQDLVDSPILRAEEAFSGENPLVYYVDNYEIESESFTWTFYKLATVKGWVDIRWYGSSNGYYGETAQIIRVENEEDEW